VAAFLHVADDLGETFYGVFSPRMIEETSRLALQCSSIKR